MGQHDCIISLRGEGLGQHDYIIPLSGKVWVNKPYILICFCRMAKATTSRCESNYIKIAMVVLRVSPRAVRVQFNKEFNPDCLQRTLRSEWGRLTGLKTDKRITQAQWNLLFPRTGRLLYFFYLNQFLYLMVLSTEWFLVDGSL